MDVRMYDIEMHEMSAEFFDCWKAAGLHLDKQVDGGINFWLRAHPYPPFLEHLSFRLGNQLFFVRIEDVDGEIDGPGTLHGLSSVTKGTDGNACILPMKRNLAAGSWEPKFSGWGLVDAFTRQPLNPVHLVTKKKIEMTKWELHDMAVQVVRDSLQKDGFQLMTSQGNPEVDPSIWFVGKTQKPEWVVVRAVKYPENQAERPANWNDIAKSCSRLSPTGHFASVAVCSGDQPFLSSEEAPVPLWRGYSMHVRFTGLT
jgi:hypothetical protein